MMIFTKTAFDVGHQLGRVSVPELMLYFWAYKLPCLNSAQDTGREDKMYAKYSLSCMCIVLKSV